MTAIAPRIRETLTELGPLSALELAHTLGVPRAKVAAVLARLRRQGEVYIRSWRREEPHVKVRDIRCRAVYALGNNPDQPKPGPLPQRVKHARWHDKRHVSPAHKRLITSVFDLGARA